MWTSLKKRVYTEENVFMKPAVAHSSLVGTCFTFLDQVAKPQKISIICNL